VLGIGHQGVGLDASTDARLVTGDDLVPHDADGGSLILLSIILTSSVLFPGISTTQIIGVLVGGVALGAMVGLVALVHDRRIKAAERSVPVEWLDRATWRMPTLEKLSRPVLSTQRKTGLFVLRGYLLIAFLLVIVKVVEVAVR
jgi:hypothetical protein